MAGPADSIPPAHADRSGSSPTGAVGPKRRILLLSYHYPPSEATGALRWQKLTTLAAARGWRVEAISLAAENAGRIDPRRVESLPAGTVIHGIPTEPLWIEKLESRLLEIRNRFRSRAVPGADPSPAGEKTAAPTSSGRPSTIARTEMRWLPGLRGLIRGYNVLLDRAQEAAFCRRARETATASGRRNRPDVVISCGPPHLIHTAARQVARTLGVPFVMDMRDPWSLQVRLPEDVASPLWYSLATRDERRCVRDAALVVMNTGNAEAAMRAIWPTAPIMSVMNGWDDEPLPSAPWPNQFRVVYAGAIYLDRSPMAWFRAIAAAVRQLGVTPAQFQVRLIGDVGSYGGASVLSLAADAGIEGFVQTSPPIRRAAVMAEYAEAAVLLSLPQDSETAIPSKIFEYVRQPAWVLAQATPTSATGMLLAGTPACVVDPDDIDRTAAFLVRCYREFQAGHRPAPIAAEGRWSRASEATRLFDALDGVVDPAAARPLGSP